MELTRRRVLGVGATGVVVVGGGVLLTRGGSTAPSRGDGEWTSFGSVALLGWTRRSLAGLADSAGPGAAAAPAAHVHGGDHGAGGESLVPSAVHGAWTDALTVDVTVHNGSPHPIELSPGQFRVRVAGGSMTVSLYAADRDAGPLGSGETARLRIDYLVPPVGLGLGLEFADALTDRTLLVARIGRGASS